MPLFGSHSKGNMQIRENTDERYGNSNELMKSPIEIKKMMQMIVKNVVDLQGRNLFDADDKDQEEKKSMIKKSAISILKQMGYVGETVLINTILEEIDKYLWGYYVIDELVNDPTVTDIRVLNWNYIRYKRYGRRYKSKATFIDENDYIQFVNLLAVRNKKSLSDVNAISYFTDTGNSKFILRFNICTHTVSSNKIPILNVRKIPKEKYSIRDLINNGMFDGKMADFLIDKAQNASGILFTGKGASGKTTLMNTLLEYIRENESAVVIQESDELFISMKKDENGNEIPAKDVAFLHTVSLSGESKLEYSLPELTRNGLRMDLDYYIIGEIKGDEAEGFSMASYTGHKCWATVHGMNSFEAINKLADYIKQATNYEFEDCLKKLIGIEIIVFMKDFKVNEITTISGFDYNTRDLVKKVIFKEGEWVN